MSGGTTGSDRAPLRTDVLVIGGGVAGLSAAADLASRGIGVILAEQKQHLGGRTYSFPHAETGMEVDNGQHLMMGCYAATFRYLSLIGTADQVRVQRRLSIKFRKRGGDTVSLRALPLPAPLHVAGGLLRLRHLPLSHRIALLRVGADLMLRNPDTDRHLSSISASAWLDELKQTTETRKYLWDIIAVGALNDAPERISAALFAKVLKSAFFGSALNASMAIPTRGLTPVLVDGAARFITSHGGRILLNDGVTGMHRGTAGIEAVTLSSGQTIEPRAVILAVPYFDVPRIIGEPASFGIDGIEEFTSSPIVTLHLWFDAHFMEEEFAALLDSPLHWVFNKSMIYGRRDALMYLSVVISGAENILDRSKEELTEMAHEELKRYYPSAAEASIVHSLVIKEKRATFSPRVGNERYRPGHRTMLGNLFLAGDWTATKLPATIEGAIQSGFACADLATQGVR